MTASVRIGITAPDATSAFALEKRLSHLRPTSVGHSDAWIVELEDDEDRHDEIVAAVRHWLCDIDLESTELHVNGAVEQIEQVERPLAMLGSEYDVGPVLTHEP
jgi:hypothetical protein